MWVPEAFPEKLQLVHLQAFYQCVDGSVIHDWKHWLGTKVMKLDKPVYVFVNAAAGQAMTMGKDRVREVVESVFGQDVILFIEDAPSLFNHLCDVMAADRPDTIIVGGGDGTISSAAKLALKHNVTLGILPLGTMNLFARALGIPMDFQDALSALASAGAGTADVGYVNGEAFFNHVSVGIHPRLIKLRDELPYDSQLSKIASGAKALVRASRTMQSYDIQFEGEFDSFSTDTSLAVVAVNPIPNALGQLPFRPGQRFGQLGLYVWSGSKDGDNDIVPVVADLLLGKWSDSTNAVHHQSSSVTLLADCNFRASIDGEVTMVSSPVNCTIEPGALSVLLPGTPGAGVEP